MRVVRDANVLLSALISPHGPFDAYLLALAVAGAAACLVTGDQRAGLLQRRQFGHTHIVTPAAFCAKAI